MYVPLELLPSTKSPASTRGQKATTKAGSRKGGAAAAAAAVAALAKVGWEGGRGLERGGVCVCSFSHGTHLSFIHKNSLDAA